MNEAWTRTSRARWEQTREGLIAKLADTHVGRDVTVYIGKLPCGFFIFDEEAGRHVHITPAYVRWVLGDRVQLDRIQL